MVLADLGMKITAALGKMSQQTLIDEKVVDEMLKDIGNALISSNVSVAMVVNLRKQIKATVELNNSAGMNMRKILQKAVFDGLINILDPGVKPYLPKKGKINVIMFVGLQGAGKTTTVSKLAHHYKRKGFSPALVCADTFRAGAFDQLRQNATKIGVPFYGSHTESDAVKTAKEGVDYFKNLKCDLIFVDTSGRHEQEASLFEEMKQIEDVVKPDNVIFVMDGSIGQSAYDQALAFKKKVAVGSVIITKLDGHAKGGGAISAVAATQSPIIFLGTGEHMEDIDPFEADSFVSKLLGMGNIKELVNKLQEVMPMDKAPEMAERLAKGKFTLRDMYEQLGNLMKMGPVNKLVEMMPGMNGLGNLLKGADGNAKIKVMINILDSMTDKELDNDKPMNKDKDMTRIIRLARGSGRQVEEVLMLLEQHKAFSKMIGKMQPLLGSKQAMRGGKMGNQDLNKMASMVPPGMLQQMGGMGGLTSMMKQFQGMNIPGFK